MYAHTLTPITLFLCELEWVDGISCLLMYIHSDVGMTPYTPHWHALAIWSGQDVPYEQRCRSICRHLNFRPKVLLAGKLSRTSVVLLAGKLDRTSVMPLNSQDKLAYKQMINTVGSYKLACKDPQRASNIIAVDRRFSILQDLVSRYMHAS